MRIVIDGRMLYWTGVGRYIQALLGELQQIDSQNEYFVLVRRADWRLWEPSASNFKKIESNSNPYSLGEQTALALQIKSLEPDLVHFTAPNAPVLFPGRRIVTIHDLTLIDYDTSRGSGLAKWMRGLKRTPFRLVLSRDINVSAALITDTQYVADQLIRRLKAHPEKIHAVLLATDPNPAEPAPLDRLGPLGRYVFYAGNAYPYKNISSTIRALALLGPTEHDVNLVIAGKRDTFTHDLEILAEQLKLKERVKFVGYVSDGELVALYRNAEVYVNPSLSEGFGLQGLEAMAQDLPVVAARASCLPEVYGEAAEYFEPLDPADQAAALTRVLADDATAKRLRAAGRERLKQFSWRTMAEQTLEAYNTAAKQ